MLENRLRPERDRVFKVLPDKSQCPEGTSNTHFSTVTALAAMASSQRVSADLDKEH